ncbi:hypothetical protein Tco_0559977 [Tanacetum coccineum]
MELPIPRIHQRRYGVSVPELTKDHEGNKPIRRIQKKAIRRIEDIVCEDSGRYQSWSLLQETPIRLRMTKVIKEEFEKPEDLMGKGVSLTCDTSLEVFNNEINRLSRIDDDLFTYEVEVTNIPRDQDLDDDSEQQVLHDTDDDIGFDPSDVTFTEWLSSKIFNYKTMDHYTIKALWIYWIRGDDEVELTDEESSNSEDDVAENKNVPWVYDKPWLDEGVWKEPKPVKHTCKPFNYKTGCSEWPTCSWRDDGFCNRGNLSGAYIIGNQLHYQDYEWYKALEDCELKEEALRNKAIMEGLINDDDDDESRYEQRKRWNIYTNYDDNRCHGVEINLIPFGSGSFDVIIGMDWLPDHKAEIICHEKVIRTPLLDGKAKEKKQEEIVVVKDFLEVFPDDLSGLSPIQEIEFRIELVPGAMSVTKSPYRLAHSELEELSGQLKELQDKELFSDYDCEIRYHPSKVNVVADALSRKDKVKPKRDRAMCNTPKSGL